jgi:two-component system, OmpR family, sensor histidine kinase KdpD
MMRFRSLRPPSPARSVVLALLGPGVAVGLGLAIDRRSLVGATSLCMLAVVIATVFGGRKSGLVASVVAFLALNFFFTEPFHTFAVRRLADLIALFVFLVVSVIVGELLARAEEARERAQRRFTEAQFLDRITAKLISGERIESVLAEFASNLVAMFDLARCEIILRDRSSPIAAHSSQAEPLRSAEGQVLEIPLGPDGAQGSLVAVRPSGAPAFGSTERSFMQALAAQAALALQRAALDLEVSRARIDAEASSLRAALFSSVTHDLRTPLASIKASASGLLAGGATYTLEQREEMLRTVVEESDRLNRIVSNLLDLARMRAGALLPSAEPVWIQDLINAVLARMRRRLESFAVRVNIRQDLPPVNADPMQIDQVFTNVLENAARFSPPGSEILITAAKWQSAVQVRISDRGPGIAVEERDRVFEEFYRADAGPARGGTGLGLAIARAIIVAHGGRIWVEGAPGGGTAIVFELPTSAVSEIASTGEAQR